MARLRIATRKSPLARWQSDYVAAELRLLDPSLSVTFTPMSTQGDQTLDRSLAAIGGKGLFLKELEQGMIADQVDCAVHSLKDIPFVLDAAFCIPAILQRANPSDAFVSNQYLQIDQLPANARIGTSSPRRQAQIRSLRPDLQVVDLRGNVNTRLLRLDQGRFDAIILASVGLQRLGLAARISQELDPQQWLPAPGQGAIAVECRRDHHWVVELLAQLDDPLTRGCVEAERAMSRLLGGDCHAAIAAYAMQQDAQLRLQGMVGHSGTGQTIYAQHCANDAPDIIAQAVAAQLIAQGATRLLGSH